MTESVDSAIFGSGGGGGGGCKGMEMEMKGSSKHKCKAQTLRREKRGKKSELKKKNPN